MFKQQFYIEVIITFYWFIKIPFRHFMLFSYVGSLINQGKKFDKYLFVSKMLL